jgi:GAF domain-containing protein
MDRVHVSGVEPLRLLVIGDRATIVGDGEDLAAALADDVCYGTVRGADLDVLTDLTPVLGAVRGAFDAWRLWRYDAVVVLVDARPGQVRAASRRHLRRLIREVTTDTSVATCILVGGLEATGGPAPLHPLAALEALGARDPRIQVVGLPMDDDVRGHARVAAWCEALGDRLRSVLPAPAGALAPDRPTRDEPDDEDSRQRALDELGVLDGDPDPHLTELAELARTVLGTASAEINVLDHDRQWKVAVAGAVPAATPRSVSFCGHTIAGPGPMIVGDAAADPAFADNPLVTAPVPIRFYAGYPIESVDGYRVGTLCVYDPEPRDPASVNVELLRDLALLAQAELTGHDLVDRDAAAIRAAAH